MSPKKLTEKFRHSSFSTLPFHFPLFPAFYVFVAALAARAANSADSADAANAADSSKTDPGSNSISVLTFLSVSPNLLLSI